MCLTLCQTLGMQQGPGQAGSASSILQRTCHCNAHQGWNSGELCHVMQVQYFAYYGSFGVNIFFLYGIKIVFILMTEFFGTCLNFVPEASASFAHPCEDKGKFTICLNVLPISS